MRAEIKKQALSIEIEAAAEYYLDFHFEELIAAKDILTFGDNHVLFELSFSNEPARVKDIIFSLQTEGYKPIMAHVERYPFYFNEWNKLEDFRNRGCLIQLNINSLSGQYGPGVKKMAEELVALTLLEAAELKNILKDEYGIEPAAGGAVMMAGPADAGV